MRARRSRELNWLVLVPNSAATLVIGVDQIRKLLAGKAMFH
jgi:hypothetical protein